MTKKYFYPMIFFAFLAVIGLFGTVFYAKKCDTQNKAAATEAEGAFSRLSGYVDGIEQDLEKIRLLPAGAYSSEIASDLRVKCSAASELLSFFADDRGAFQNLELAIDRAAAYAGALCGGKECLGDRDALLTAVINDADDFKSALAEISDSIKNGGASYFGSGNSLASLLRKYDDGMTKIELSYDGAYSSHLDNVEPAFVAGGMPRSEEEAAAAAEKAGFPALGVVCESDGDIPCYVLGNDYVSVFVTKTSGKILSFSRINAGEGGSITADEARKKAEETLEASGYPGLYAASQKEENGSYIFTCCHSEKGIICYPDSVTVVISKSGEPILLNAREYLMNHTARDICVPENPENKRVAIIATPGKKEVLCFEISAPGYTLWSDAETGEPVKAELS